MNPGFRRPERARAGTRQGFTLIELLTVIAIIGILAAILIPVVGEVRAKARMTTDTSNLREIGKAVALYLAENRNKMPHNYSSGSFDAGEIVTDPINGPRRAPVYESIDRYFVRRDAGPTSIYNYAFRPIWFSRTAQPVPSGRTQGSDTPTAVNGSNPYGDYAHFSFNPFIWSNRSNGGGTDRGQWRADMSIIPSPSRTVLMAETNNRFGVGNQDLDPGVEPATASDLGTLYRVSQPGGLGLYLFCDFSVRTLVGNQGVSVNPSIWKWW